LCGGLNYLFLGCKKVLDIMICYWNLGCKMDSLRRYSRQQYFSALAPPLWLGTRTLILGNREEERRGGSKGPVPHLLHLLAYVLAPNS